MNGGTDRERRINRKALLNGRKNRKWKNRNSIADLRMENRKKNEFLDKPKYAPISIGFGKTIPKLIFSVSGFP
jgi:hypothetical protein